LNRLKISGGIAILFILVGAFFVRGFITGAAHASGAPNCTWTLVPIQNPSTSTNIYASTAIAPKDVWMVGSFINHGSSGPFLQTLTEQWNGTAWNVVPSPNPGTDYNALLGVARIPGGGLWAVGYTNGPGTDQTLIERWDGKSWQVVPSPNVGSDVNSLYGVVALSATDAWAVGSYTSAAQPYPQEVLIEHWDGTQWSVVQGANPSPTWNDLASIAASSATDVWAVGFQRPEFGGQSTATLIEHWNGTQWSIVKSPSPGSYSNGLSSISIVSATSIWAVGGSSNVSSPTQTLTEHWDGTRWSVVASPDPDSAVDVLNSVVALGANNVWAAGYDVGAKNLGSTLVLHWDGKAWIVSRSPNGGSNYDMLEAVARVPGTGQVWAAGVDIVPGTDQEASFSLFRC
jgi:hypothetical protein